MEVEREGGGWEEEEEEGGLERDTVRGCLVLGPDLEGKKESQFANLRCKAHTALLVGMHETSHGNIFVERKNEQKNHPTPNHQIYKIHSQTFIHDMRAGHQVPSLENWGSMQAQKNGCTRCG